MCAEIPTYNAPPQIYKENRVQLLGQLLQKRALKKKENTISMMFTLKVIRRSASSIQFGTNGSHLTQLLVITSSHDHIVLLENIMEGDFLDVSGFLCTSEASLDANTLKCPTCHGLFAIPSINCFIIPIRISKVDVSRMSHQTDPVSKRKGLEYLSFFQQDSNSIIVKGKLCDDPILYSEGRRLCVYKVVPEELPDEYITETYKRIVPWIRTFGSQGEMDSIALVKGSIVYIEGSLHPTIKETGYIQAYKCPFCECALNISKNSHMDIVPYRVEYLSKYREQASSNTLLDDFSVFLSRSFS